MPKDRRPRRPNSRQKPAKVGNDRHWPERLELTIQDVASDGRGVARLESGQVCFISGVWRDEVVLADVQRNAKIAQGTVVEILSAHPERVDPPCQYHGTDNQSCGGCPWQFMAYGEQLEQKRVRVAQAVHKLGITQENIGSVVKSPVAAPEVLGYRNRAQLKTDGARLGYVAQGTRQLVDIESCPVLTTECQKQLGALREQLPNNKWRPNRRDDWTTLDIDDQRKEVLVDERQPFRQGNDAQNAVMRNWLSSQLAGLPKDATAVELFAGSGNFTEVISAVGFDAVVAVEVEGEATDLLAARALPAVTVKRADLFAEDEVLALATKYKRAEMLVLDPPRDGLKVREPILRKMRALESVLYISCDVATWARDVADFLAAGFELVEVTPVDMFPQTPHIEVMSLLRKK